VAQTQNLLAEVAAALTRGVSYNYQTEDELQRAISSVLDDAGFTYEREVQLSPRQRIDFLVMRAPDVSRATPSSGIGVEIKIGGSLAHLTAQAYGYALSGRVLGLLIVTTRARHTALPREMASKQVRVVNLVMGVPR
jgi:hypothetical protein